MEELVTELSAKFFEIQGWLLLTFFMCLHNQLSSFNSNIVQIHQIDSKNGWLLVSLTFTAKLELIFLLTFKNAFSQSFHFKVNRKIIGSSKKRYQSERKPFSKNWSTVFQLKPPRLKTHHFHSKLLCQNPMLRQIEQQLQNEPITKSGVLPVTTLFFRKLCSSFRTS